jgi:hypothetical protein
MRFGCTQWLANKSSIVECEAFNISLLRVLFFGAGCAVRAAAISGALQVKCSPGR